MIAVLYDQLAFNHRIQEADEHGAMYVIGPAVSTVAIWFMRGLGLRAMLRSKHDIPCVNASSNTRLVASSSRRAHGWIADPVRAT